ncbi:LysR family transcriptional regulator [Hoeflea sp. TYP-13]|uniref:LysR family transcriptional regulator n=1 Tax=Hoeflea sp. TYP-13 TaxID=3230023 RepID=UPI0034C5D6C8
MDIATLKLFVDVAKRQSFAAVARDHDQDPSTVSRTIANLETELGIRLFQRTTRNMNLTEAGEIYLNRMETLIEYMDNAREEALSVSAHPTGSMRITATIAFGQLCLVPLLPQLRQEFPDLRLELHLTDSQIDLVANRVDLAVRLGSRIGGDVIATKLFDSRYLVCASREYLEKHSPINHPIDLVKHRCLLLRTPSVSNNWVARSATGRETVMPVDGDIVISSVLALRQCARGGLGPTLLPEWMVKADLLSGELVNVLPEHEIVGGHAQAAAWLVYPSKRYLPYKVRVIVDFLKRSVTNGWYAV